jgi:GNAT superfamily N-acetyltransferase
VTPTWELESVAARAWPAAEVEALGGWRLRYTSGVTRRGNSVWPGPGAPSDGGPGPLAAAIERAERFYAERGAPARFQLVPGCEALDAALAERGYRTESPVSVQTVDLSLLAARPAGGAGIEVEVADACSADWWSVAGERSRFATVQNVYSGLLARIGARAGFALARRRGAPVATALGVADAAWAGVFSMLVLPEERRRGAARALLGGLARWASARGAERLYLQVERDNPAALALYASAGFRERYGYHYRLRAG